MLIPMMQMDPLLTETEDWENDGVIDATYTYNYDAFGNMLGYTYTEHAVELEKITMLLNTMRTDLFFQKPMTMMVMVSRTKFGRIPMMETL